MPNLSRNLAGIAVCPRFVTVVRIITTSFLCYHTLFIYATGYAASLFRRPGRSVKSPGGKLRGQYTKLRFPEI